MATWAASLHASHPRWQSSFRHNRTQRIAGGCIYAGIDPGTGQVYFGLFTLDPATGLPPSVDIGVLPPEDGTGRGQGWFSFTIRAKQDTPSGTEIRNVALIKFDANDPIATNQVDPHDPSQGTDPTKEALVTIRSNVAPVAGADSVETTEGKRVSVTVANLLMNDIDADGDPLSLSIKGATSEQGGTVALSDGLVTYTPPRGFYGLDTIFYTVRDVFGASGQGEITVVVYPADPTIRLTMLGDGRARLEMAGVSGRTYVLEASGNLIDWTAIATLQAGEDGEFEFVDDGAGTLARRFYRLRAP